MLRAHMLDIGRWSYLEDERQLALSLSVRLGADRLRIRAQYTSLVRYLVA